MTGNEVKDLRCRKSLTQIDMAYLIDVTPKSIKNWEKAGDKEVKQLYVPRLKALDNEYPDATEQIRERLNAI